MEGSFHANRQDRIIAITGSGNSDYLWALKRDLMDAFKESDDLDSFESRAVDTVFSFYERHIIPFNPQQWGDLRVEVIIAAKLHGKCGLWKTSKNN
jgi:hypothetical protein